ncbi:MAG: hypothetical protein HZA60_01030 [Deltaproteobacteria bacterium]|nr:hypothetical protein [Deltaproteobacteria bacterium]
MKRAAILSAAGLLLSAADGCAPKSGTVEGRATVAGAPAGGVEIRFFVKAGEERTGTPFAVKAAGNEGAFRMELPPGLYYVIARKTAREGGRDKVYKGEYSRNPVSVRAGKAVSGVDIALAEMSSAGFVPQEGTGVSGTVLSGGKPARDAYVYAYSTDAGTVRGPAYVAFARTDDQGRFRLLLREGSFVIVARRKGSENETGAMQPKGESGGEGERVALASGTMKEIGVIALHPLKEEKRRLRAEAGGQEKQGAMLLGAVVRDDGSPGAGVHVMAYADRRMIGRPFAISGKTGTDGVFLLRLPRAGKFYLGARSERGGPVSPGEWVGTFDAAPDHSVEVARGGKKEGLKIRVIEKW